MSNYFITRNIIAPIETLGVLSRKQLFEVVYNDATNTDNYNVGIIVLAKANTRPTRF